MNKDDIIRMAQSVGADTYGTMVELGIDELWDFAALVAAAEREACAQVCLMPVDEIQVTDDCSEYVYKDHLDCAEAIRARGQ